MNWYSYKYYTTTNYFDKQDFITLLSKCYKIKYLQNWLSILQNYVYEKKKFQIEMKFLQTELFNFFDKGEKGFWVKEDVDNLLEFYPDCDYANSKWKSKLEDLLK